MSVKRNSLSGLKALIDFANSEGSSGSTDDLGEGQVYVAKIIREIRPDTTYVTRTKDGIDRPSRLYKIKLEEELGDSTTGGELLFTDSEKDLKLLGAEGEKQMTNLVVNLLPEGIFIGTETPEFPGVGDEVYATSDGGIEGRYLLSLKSGRAKGSAAGYSFSDAELGAISGALAAFSGGANGTPVSELLSKTQDWSGDPKKWSQEKKLASLDGELAAKVATLMTNLINRGFQPMIFYAWRDTATQARLNAAGNSSVNFSFHNATKNGQPNALGADIVDKRWWWENGTPEQIQSFRTAIGEEAKKLGLIWGGDWQMDDWAHVQLLPNNQLARIRNESDENLSFA